jgi:hypothetical protein
MSKERSVTERFVLFRVPTFIGNDRVPVMIYPWPLNVDAVLNEALEIAMHYLEVTGQADAFFQTQATAASAILNAWQAGARHKIRLANCAIVAVENNVVPVAGQSRSQSFYPRVG